jgi:propionyl-CoA carboxylase alpha chain
MREDMGSRAVALAQSVNYNSAGTCEFIVDQERNYYFLEMNTRLQVEHSVTEFTTGIDLVEWMIRVAAGERLTITQRDVKMRGWAVEARVYAEDPNRKFMPSVGRLVRYRTPEESSQVRVDSGVYEGGEISHFYDPMIAKVTTWDLSRSSAITRMRRALDEFYIKGVEHNIAFLTALMANRRFLEGQLTTNFIDEEYPEGFSPAPLEENELEAVLAAAILMHLRYLHRAARITGAMPGYRRQVPRDWVVVVDDRHFPVSVEQDASRSAEEGFDIFIGGRIVSIHSDWQINDPVMRCTVNAVPQRFKVERAGLGYRLYHLGSEISVMVYRKEVAELAKLMPKRKAADMSKYVVSPMPGLLRSLAREPGEKVEAGDEIAVVEAMKMENIIRSTTSGVIARFHAEAGEIMKVGQIIAEFE